MTSHDSVIDRFNSLDVARRYPSSFGQSFRERREVASLKAALQHVEAASHILDLPCGTGRLLPVLHEAGFQVTASDSSSHMLNQAQLEWKRARAKLPNEPTEIRFTQNDVMNTSFDDGQFNAVVCHRLFHHLTESSNRVKALQELRRISRSVVIISFFNSFALDAVKYRLKHFFRGTIPKDRIPIPLRVLSRDIDEAGLCITSRHSVLWGISPMWFLVLHTKDS